MTDTNDTADLAHRRSALSAEQRRLLDSRLRGGADARPSQAAIPRRDASLRIPLSYAQRSLWLTWKLDPTSPAYNMPGALQLHGALDATALQRSLQVLIERHEILRTCYCETGDGEPEQRILPALPVQLPCNDLSSIAPEARAMQLQHSLRTFAAAPFQLEVEPPFRTALYRLAVEEHVLALALHHIAGDAWSIRILVEEFFAVYAALCRGAAPSLAPLPIQFADYALWQRQRLDSGVHQAQLEHWRARLNAAAEPLQLPFDRPRTQHGDAAEGRHAFQLSASLSERLRALQRTRQTSLFMVMLALLKLLLYRFSGQRDLQVGTPLANRQKAETHGLIGCLLNVQVLRTRLDATRSFAELLACVRDTVLDAQAHHDIPFDLLVDALQPERRAGVHPLFQVKCTQVDDLPAAHQVAGLNVSIEELSSGHAHFDLSLDFIDAAGGIRCVFVYARTLFEPATLQRLAHALESLAEQVAADSDRPLAALTLPGPGAQLHGPQAEFEPADVLLQWSRAVERVPQRVAIAAHATGISYTALAAQVRHLANTLLTRGVGPDVRVGVYAERSSDFVLGVLAVLQANGAYVPLDMQLPAERLAQQLTDSGAQLLLAARAPSWQPAIPVLPLTVQPLSDGCSAPVAAPAAHPQQLAYVIYTSGSTGQPKGVSVTRGALANYVQAVLARLDLPPTVTRMAMVSSVAADLGHTTFFGALCSGRSLHLIDAERVFDPDRFASYMAEHGIEVLKIVPSHLQALLQAAQTADVLPSHSLVLGGEATHWPLLERVHALRPDCRVINHYGPTETTVGALTQQAATAQRSAATLPLGWPLANMQALLLDAELNVVPRGVVGELYLSGTGVARGYQGRAGQSAERFVAHPQRCGERMYRTGDRARQLADGSLEFLGRADDQVKIRGYRVELGEVRAALLAQQGVSEVAVTAQQVAGRMQLHAYVVARAGVVLGAAELRSALAAVVPEYMLPAACVMLDALPLTANGKLDQRALPAPDEVAARASAASYSPPQGAREQLLATLWAEVLRVPRVGRHDEFFALGGDSILTLQVVARARKQGLPISPRQLMELQTVARIVAAQASATVEPAPEADAVPTRAEPLLTPIQRWFFAQPLSARQHWNQSVLLAVDGPPDAARLRQALVRLVEQHPALRSRFVATRDGVWTVELRREAQSSFGFEVVDLSVATDTAAAIERTAQAAQRALHLADGPLLNAVWLRLGAGQRDRLLLIAHHLVIDVVSWRVLVEALQSLDNGTHDGPLASDNFAQWTQQLARYAASERCTSQLAYWQAVDQEDAPWPRSAAVTSSTANTVGAARSVQFALSRTQTDQLLRDCPRAYRTRVEDLLLSALARCLCTWTGLDSVRLELEGHGREALFDLDLSRSVGWFTSLYPVRLTPGANVRQTILAIKEQLRQVPDRGVGYAALRHGAGNTALQAAQPYLTFNYLGQMPHASEGAWSLAHEPHGPERAPDGPRRAWFEIIAKVEHGCLQVDWHYSAALHDAATLQALAADYAAALGAVIEHCMQPEAGGLSPSDMPLAQLSQAQIDDLRLDHARIEHVYPLAPLQQGLLLHTLLNAGAGMYLMQDHYRFAAELDVSAFQQAWDSVVQRHAALRTGFLWQGEHTQLQVVHRQVPSAVQFCDWRALGEEAALRRLEQELQQELSDGFDLTRPPLMKLRLVQLGERDFYLVQSFHHILMDAWCRSLLLTDFFAHYEEQRAGRVVQRPRPRPYRDFIGWLQRQDRAAARAFWREQLQGVDSATALPWRKQLAVQGTATVIDQVQLLSVAETAALQSLAQARQLTLNTIVQGAWALLLSRLASVPEVLFGVTVAGRPLELEGIQDTVGLFINTIPLRTTLPAPHTPVVQWLQALLAHNLAMRQHEHLQLVEIQALSGLPRGRSLFDSLFVFENAPLDESLQQRTQTLGIRTLGNRTHTNYPLTVVVIPGRQLWLQLSCDSRCFEAPEVARLLGCFKQMVVQIGAQPQARLSDLSLMSPGEQVDLMQLCAGPRVPYPFARGYVALFEEQVRRHGERPAARCRGQTLSYAALNAGANRIAHALRSADVRGDDVVALWGDRGLSLLTVVLGSLKAGAAYLALDAALPAQRIITMLRASRARVVLACAANAATITAVLSAMPDPPRLLIDTQLQSSTASDHNAGTAVHLDQAAYVIYTSGSTGEPKGVVVTHGGMLNNQLSKIPYLGLSCHDVIAQTAAASFDISVWQLLAGLLCGACSEIVPDEIARDPQALLHHVHDTGVTVLQSVPALIQGMLAAPPLALPRLRWMLPTGEASTTELAQRWFERHATVPLVNAYGPAECADDVALHRVLALEAASAQYLPIGRPTDNTRLYVLDAALELLPVGVGGELYVAGAGVGRGYLHRPDLTAERFVANPHAQQPGERLYRTGDLARYRADGVLEYLGRADSQVKIRGFRIELGEIEAHLARLEEVRAAAVCVHADALGTPQLVGYVVPVKADDNAALASNQWREALRTHLRGVLPEYMVPTLWVALPCLPLTPNGKLDRKALPAPQSAALQSVYEPPAIYEPPEGEIEATLAAVWSEVLGVTRIGRGDNFFDLGGHSLLAMQVIARLRQRLQIEVPLNTVFAAPTVQQFAACVAALSPQVSAAALLELDAFLDSLEQA